MVRIIAIRHHTTETPGLPNHAVDQKTAIDHSG
jgi:hypothetical protein